MDKEIAFYNKGVNNLADSEVIPANAASVSQNFYTQDGRIKLIPGKLLEGNVGVAGAITGEIFGYKIDGTKVHWRKAGTKIQYLSGSTWTDVVTGLTSSADYTFSNYSSLAGAFTFAFGIDGIYKFNNANPGSYCSLYVGGTTNFHGYAFIDRGRTILWNRPESNTALYGSKIDKQRIGTEYTSVTGEATTSLSGTLAFKAGGARRNCFSVAITITATGEVYTDSYLGTLSGSLGGTGTINYITGAYTLSNAGVGTAAYQWEDSSANGLTDFGSSATRLAGEGFRLAQDEGGDAILNVLIGPDGNYYSIKKNSSYVLTIDATDLVFTNTIYRKGIGVQSLRGSYSSSVGIIFMNMSNPEKPEMTVLEKNLVGDNLQPKVLFPQFKFANYLYNDATIYPYERYILVACKTLDATNNDTLLLCDIAAGTVDITNYSGRTFASNGTYLYMGSSIGQSVYQLFTGFDDDTFPIDAYWIGKAETWGSPLLKKYRKIRLKGNISIDQGYQVYINYDGSGFQLVGTVLGTGSYVDYNSPQSIGSNYIGSSQIGGDTLTNIYPYFLEIRLKKVPKFRSRQVKFVPTGIGYLDIDSHLDVGIETFQNKLPPRFRQKQNVSLAGDSVDNANPEF